MENKTFVISKIPVNDLIETLSLMKEKEIELIDIIASLGEKMDSIMIQVREEYKETFPIDYNSLV